MRPPVRLKDLPEKEYERITQRFSSQLEKIIPQIVPIIKKVQQTGDEAVLAYTQEFDKVKLSTECLLVSEQQIKRAYKKVSPSFISSIKHMRQQVENFHLHQIPKNWAVEKDEPGSFKLGQKFSPVRKAAVYVPGGKAGYPSTAIMGCVPAKLAGVEEVVVCSPPCPEGRMRDEVIVASSIGGADVLINAGGPQAIAALAYGTQNIPQVDMVVGPGNIYVTCAKAYLASLGKVGIDCPAGPSEVLIIGDENAPPSYIIWDMLSQAEHDEASWSVLVTDSEKLARKVHAGIKKQMHSTERKDIICSSLKENGLIIITEDISQAVDFANQFAPEHLEIMTANPEPYLPRIKNAGSVFLGSFSPVAAGDYFTGTNHILPTGGTARFFSGVSVNTFLKAITYQHLSSKALSSMHQPISHLALKEGFQAHLESIRIRGSDLDI